MLSFFFKAFVFDFVYSFLVGLVMTVVLLPFTVFSDSEEPGWISFSISLTSGILLCAVQGIMLASAVVFALKVEPSRWDIVWYLVGFFFSVPIALIRSLGDSRQGEFATAGILSADIAYVLACIFPAHIPLVLRDTAVALLL